MARELEPGQKAPDFTLPDQDGTPVSLKSLRGQPVVLYFYPKDDTPGCTKEACDFRDAQPRFTKGKAVVLGVSLDSGESHRKFIAKFSLPFRLLSDEDAKVSKAYGVYKQKSMYGKTYWGIERSTFVIGPDGTVERALYNVRPKGHAASLLSGLT